MTDSRSTTSRLIPVQSLSFLSPSTLPPSHQVLCLFVFLCIGFSTRVFFFFTDHPFLPGAKCLKSFTVPHSSTKQTSWNESAKPLKPRQRPQTCQRSEWFSSKTRFLSLERTLPGRWDRRWLVVGVEVEQEDLDHHILSPLLPLDMSVNQNEVEVGGMWQPPGLPRYNH